MPYGVDYLIFRNGFYRDIPPFAVGRTAWDNWLLWYHRKARVPLVTLTDRVLAIHQAHSTASDWKRLNESPEVKANRRLASYWQRSFTLADATHALTSEGIRSRRGLASRNRQVVMRGFLRHCLSVSWARLRARFRQAPT
jgi:hypothetical protein